MKIFHLSDLHIGLRLYNRDLAADQKDIFLQICNAAEREQPDAIVIAGDLFDKAIPSAEAVELFDWFITMLHQAASRAELMAVSGNHDSASRVNIYRSVLARQRIHMVGLPPQEPEEHIEKVTLQDAYGPVHFYLLPFVKPSVVRNIVGSDTDGNSLSYSETVKKLLERESINTGERNVLVSHQFYLPVSEAAETVERMDSEIRTVGNIDQVSAACLAPFDYAALGHIHKPMTVGSDRYWYCGTPLPYSVSEAGQQKQIVMAELGAKGDIRVTSVPLHPKRQVKILRGLLGQILQQSCEDYVSVILTDPVDLDVIDMQDRLRCAFPNLLEIRRETLRPSDAAALLPMETEPDVFALCSAFLKDLTEEEQTLLRDIVNAAKEAQV